MINSSVSGMGFSITQQWFRDTFFSLSTFPTVPVNVTIITELTDAGKSPNGKLTFYRWIKY
jgi:hypothetical protein